MAQVIRPQVVNRDQEAFTVGGAALGAAFGGPQGAVAGAGIGQTAGNMLGPQQAAAPSLGGGGESQASAMSRRQAQQSQDSLATLKQAEAQLPSLPEDLRQQYSPAIIEARMLEERKRGMA